MSNRYDYVYGAAAPKLPPQEQKPHVVKRKYIKKTVSIPQQIKYPTFQILFCVLISFGLLFTLISRHAVITEMNSKIVDLNLEHQALREINQHLKVEVGNKMNLENVRDIAQTRLGMRKPDGYQLIPVYVPRINYSQVSESLVSEKEPAWRAFLRSFFRI